MPPQNGQRGSASCLLTAIEEKIKAQCITRKKLRNQLRTVKEEPQRFELLNQAAELSIQIKLRKECACVKASKNGL